MSEFPLGSLFSNVTFEDWTAAAQKALRGADFNSLHTHLYEGLTVDPLYTRDDTQSYVKSSGSVGCSPFIRGSARSVSQRPWTIIQLLDHLDLDEARRQLREDHANGATAFWLQLGGNIPYGGAFIGARKLEALEKVFADIPLDKISLYVSGGFDTVPGAGLMAALFEKRGILPSRIKGSAGFDPISQIAARGYIPAERKRVFADAVDAATYFREKTYGWQPFLVSGRAWHQAGGSAREELGLALASAVTYWRALIDAGWPLEDAADAISFCLTAESDLFLTIAKFRAMRALWARVTEAGGLQPRQPVLIAEMSYRSITERDPHVNMLRAAAAAFGAGVGGADAVMLIPFNTRHGTPDRFARRIARNTHLVLQEEAQLGQIADAAGGSYYVESLTHQLAATAWEAFRRTEAEGGILAALENGAVGRKLADTSMRRSTHIARNLDKITGVSSFPNLAEETLFSRPEDLAIDVHALDEEGDPLSFPAAEKGKRFAAIVEAATNGATLPGIERGIDTLMERYDFIPSVTERAAAPFEHLRAASDRALARVRTRPPVFLANLGTVAEYNARASWARSFFAAGGIEVVDEGGFTEIDTLVRQFQLSTAPVACICAGGAMLTDMPGVATALKNGGAAAVYLVAQPSHLGALSEAHKHGVDRIIYDGCNMLKILSELHEMMRVKELGEIESDEFDEDEDDDTPSLNGS